VALSNQVWEPMSAWFGAADANAATNFNNGVTGMPVGAINSNSKIVNVSTPSQPGNLLVVAASGTPTSANGYSYQLFTLIDTLVTAPVIGGPKANAQINPLQSFTWTPIASPVTLTYEIQIATDDQFQGIVVDRQTQAGSYYTTAADGLVQGQKYFWRVYVAQASNNVITIPGTATVAVNTNPWSSKKPAAVSILVKLGTTSNDLTGTSGNRIAPIAGATGQPLRPTFQWSAVQNADSYELELADNPFFANAQAKKPLQNTIWTWDKDLTAGTTYYWRVRAVSAGNASDWVSSVFTTATAAQLSGTTATVAPPAPPVTVTTTATPPPAPKFFEPNSGLYFNTQAELQQYQAAHPGGAPTAPGTPPYIWVIIAIGAILVIAVIVLIARTRRV
jgi:hypothetical protein